MEYRNFDLSIQPRHDNCYRVVLLPSEAEECLCDSILSAEMNTLLEKLERGFADDLSPEELLKDANLGQGIVDLELIKEFGDKLYQCLFRGSIRDALFKALGEVERGDDLNLRLRLIIEPPEIARLPWELLFDKKQNLFLCTYDKTSIVRYLKVPPSSRDLTVRLPLRVLVVIPEKDYDLGEELNTAAERKNIETAFAALVQARIVKLDFLDPPVTLSRLYDKLNDGIKYHIFHFIGHGCFDRDVGYLKINPETTEGEEDLSDELKKGWLPADSFANLFTNHRSMKLVVLNSCEGARISSTRPLAGLAPQLFLRNIPAVVAMQYPIFDDSALIFSREFYRKFCRGHQRGLLDPAVISARNRILIGRSNGLDFATPVLLMHTSSGLIFAPEEDDGGPAAPSPAPSVDQVVSIESDVEIDSTQSVPRVARGLKGLPRKIATSIETLDETPRLNAVEQARAENLVLLKREKNLAPEDADHYDLAIGHEERQLAAIRSRLSAAAKTSVRLSVAALLIGFLMLAAAVFGVFNVIGIEDWLQQRVSSAARRAAAAGPFANDRVRVILVDPTNHEVQGFPNQNRADDRAFHAQLIDALAVAGARVVALDISLYGENAADVELAAAIERAAQKGTQVLVGVEGVTDTGQPQDPFPLKLQETLKNRWGNINVGLGYELGSIDFSGFHVVTRHVELGKKITADARPLPNGGVPVSPSLVLQALMPINQDSSSDRAKPLFYENETPQKIKLSSPESNAEEIPVADDEMSFMITMASDAAIDSVRRTYQDVYLHRGDVDFMHRNYGDDRIVLIGYGVENDRHFVSGTRQRYGVEIQANVISNILQRIYARKVPWEINLLVILLMVLLGFLLRSRFGQKLSFPIGFESPTLNRMLKIPVGLLSVTILYFVVIYFVYSRSVYVVDMTPHIVTLFLAYWFYGLRTSRKRKGGAPWSTYVKEPVEV